MIHTCTYQVLNICLASNINSFYYMFTMNLLSDFILVWQTNKLLYHDLPFIWIHSELGSCCNMKKSLECITWEMFVVTKMMWWPGWYAPPCLQLQHTWASEPVWGTFRLFALHCHSSHAAIHSQQQWWVDWRPCLVLVPELGVMSWQWCTSSSNFTYTVVCSCLYHSAYCLLLSL